MAVRPPQSFYFSYLLAPDATEPRTRGVLARQRRKARVVRHVAERRDRLRSAPFLILLTMTTDLVNNNVIRKRGVGSWRAGPEAVRETQVSDRKLARNDGDDTAPRARKSARSRENDWTRARLGVLNDHLGYFMRRAQVWVFQDFIRALAGVNIRPAQYSVLVVIGANPSLSQADLADMLNIERARLVRLLNRLEKRGLTERRPSPADRRSHALHLTRKGRTLLKRAKALAALHEARLAEKLGPERRKLMLAILRNFDR
jgi:DNA-binding MarR family transcriptional regulator